MTDNKVYRRSFLAAFGLLPMMALFPIFNVYVPVILQTGHPLWVSGKITLPDEIPGFGLSPSMSYFIMTWDNIAGIILAWWIGRQSDRFGNSRKPWIIVGVLMAAISFALLPIVNSLYLFLFFVLLFSTGLAVFRTPALAWLGDLFKQQERSRANGMFMLLRGLMGVFALVAAALIYKHGGITWLFVIVAVIAITLSLVAVLTVDESASESTKQTVEKINAKHLIKQPKLTPLLILILTLYMAYQGLIISIGPFAKFELNIDLSIVPLAMALFLFLRSGFSIPFGVLGERWGHEKMTTVGLLLLFLANIAGYFLVHSTPGFFIYLAFMGPLIAMTLVSILPMLFAICHKIGHATTISLFVITVQIGAIIGPISFGWFVEISETNRASLLSAAACIFIAFLSSYYLFKLQHKS